MDETFEPLPDIPMDKSFTLEQLTGRFQSVRDGLPELPKNSKDQYVRLGIHEKERRQIVILVSSDMTRLGVLDFGGAREADFEGWQKWSSREAGRTSMGSDIEAGYGNGGKAFMVRGSTGESYMRGFTDGRTSKMGFRNDDPSMRYRPGWYRDGLDGNTPRATAERELDEELGPFGLKTAELPPAALKVFQERKSFTIVVVGGVKDWMNSRSREGLIRHLPYDLMSHPQMALTIETCTVWVLKGRALLFPGPLRLEELDPFPGFDEPVRKEVPETLPDPRTEEKVSTGPRERFLELRTSFKNLRLGANRPLNVIRVRNARNVVASWPVADLVPTATSAFIYGVLRVPGLENEHLAGAERQSLADTPLVRALREWAEQHVRALAQAIQKAQMTREREEDRDSTNDALRRMRELMRKFLEAQTTNGGSREYGAIIHEILLEPGKQELVVPVGTTVPLVFKCYERDRDRRLPVLRPRVHMVAEPVGVVSFNGFSSIRVETPGVCTIRLENLEGNARSNEVYVRAVEIAAAEISGPSGPIKQGETVQLAIKAQDLTGEQVEGAVWETSIDELDLGRIGRTGIFTAGKVEGTATVSLRFGDKAENVASTKVTIGPEKVERQPPNRGDIPLLLLCGTPAPGREDLPDMQRTHPPGSEYPTIIDFDPQWENVVWLNMLSAEALKVRGGKGGTSGAMRLTTMTVYQFLALKCFEVLRRLKVRQIYEDQSVTPLEFLQTMSVVETEAAGFLDAAYNLVGKLLSGTEFEGG
jgi:hypothetical protein